MIAYYHTSAIHPPRFEQITKAIDSNTVTYHHVNETILEKAMQEGKISDALKQTFKNDIITTVEDF